MSTPQSQLPPPKVSIIIPLYNAVSYTKKLLETLFITTQHIPCEYIFIDNDSSDETEDVLMSIGHKATCIFNAINRNFAGACNQGAAIAKSPYLLFLNNDIELSDGWLEPMVNILDTQDEIGIVGNKQLFPDRSVHHCGVVFNKKNEANHYLLHTDEDDIRTNVSRELNCVTGSCFLIRNDLFTHLNGFDERFINGHEDVDLCLRARKYGAHIWYCSESVIIHHTSKSPGRKNRQNIRHNSSLYEHIWGRTWPCDEASIVENDKHLIESYRKKPFNNLRMSVILPDCDNSLNTSFLIHLIKSLRSRIKNSFSSLDSDIYLLTSKSRSSITINNLWVDYSWSIPTPTLEEITDSIVRLQTNIVLLPILRETFQNFPLEEFLNYSSIKNLKVIAIIDDSNYFAIQRTSLEQRFSSILRYEYLFRSLEHPTNMILPITVSEFRSTVEMKKEMNLNVESTIIFHPYQPQDHSRCEELCRYLNNHSNLPIMALIHMPFISEKIPLFKKLCDTVTQYNVTSQVQLLSDANSIEYITSLMLASDHIDLPMSDQSSWLSHTLFAYSISELRNKAATSIGSYDLLTNAIYELYSKKSIEVERTLHSESPSRHIKTQDSTDLIKAFFHS